MPVALLSISSILPGVSELLRSIIRVGFENSGGKSVRFVSKKLFICLPLSISTWVAVNSMVLPCSCGLLNSSSMTLSSFVVGSRVVRTAFG